MCRGTKFLNDLSSQVNVSCDIRVRFSIAHLLIIAYTIVIQGKREEVCMAIDRYDFTITDIFSSA